MRKALAAFGVASTLLVSAPASATIFIAGPGINSDPHLLPFLPGLSTPNQEAFDSLSTGTTGNFSTAFASYSGNGIVVNGSVTNQFAAPFIGPGIADPTNYLATGTSGHGGTETLTFSGQHNVFALYWGSIDTYNTITFFNGNTQIATFTGLAVLPPANGNQGSFATNADVEFSNLGLFNKVVFQSSQAAFEVDNLQVGPTITTTPPVPEASTWLMMILGFFSLGFVAYRRKGRAMQLRIA